MLYEDVDFKTLSDRYTNSRIVPFLTHIHGVRANLFSINPRQKMTPTMVNQQFSFFFFFFFCFFFFFFVVVFFTVKLDAANSFPSNTAEVRPIYLKMGQIMRKPVLSYVNNKGADQPAHQRSLISAFVVRCLVSNEILQFIAI